MKEPLDAESDVIDVPSKGVVFVDVSIYAVVVHTDLMVTV